MERIIYVALSPFFYCESLEELELDFLHNLRIPLLVYFSNLKILTLTRVVFADDNSVKQLFSSCPKLKKLELIECQWDNVKVGCVSTPMLEQLKISEYDDDGKPDCYQFMISGSRLEFFHYAGGLSFEYYIFETPSLVDAYVHVYLREIRNQRLAACRVHKLLRGLANVENLIVSSQTFQVYFQALIVQ